MSSELFVMNNYIGYIKWRTHGYTEQRNAVLDYDYRVETDADGKIHGIIPRNLG